MKRSELKQIIREVIEEGRVLTKEPQPIFKLNAKGERLFDADMMSDVTGVLIGFAIVNTKKGYVLDNETGEIWELDDNKVKNPKISAVRKLPIYTFKYEEFESGFPMFDDVKEAKEAAKSEGKDYKVFEIRRSSKPYEKKTRRFKEEGNENNKFNYMLLSRLQQDCDYYLSAGNRSKKNLWAGDECEQIDKMFELYDLCNPKPDWISLEDIKNYESQMCYIEEGYAGSDEDLLGFIETYMNDNDFEGIDPEDVMSQIERHYRDEKGEDYKNQGLSYYQELVDFAEEIQPGAGIPWIQWILENVR